MLRLWRYRDAVLNLALLNLRLRYHNSLLGAAWSVVNPLFFAFVFTFVFTSLLTSDTPRYPVFALAALLPWNFFQAALLSATASVSNGCGLLTRLAFPPAVLPLATILTELVTFTLALVTILTALALLGELNGAPLWALLPLIAVLTALVTGLGLLLAALNARLRDTGEFLSVFLFGWFFLTPVIYDFTAIPAARQIAGLSARTFLMLVNPIAPLVSAFRAVIYERRLPDWSAVTLSAAISAGVFLVGAAVFSARRHTFVEGA